LGEGYLGRIFQLAGTTPVLEKRHIITRAKFEFFNGRIGQLLAPAFTFFSD
jgi:hypothetical protein